MALPQGALSGELALPYAPAQGLIVVPGCGAGDETARETAELLRTLHAEGFATLEIGLLRADECRFADACGHPPLLGERLLAVLSELRRQMLLDATPALPIGLATTGATTPPAVRAAAQRDRDVRALVCAGGLVDLAGLQYLKLLEAPLLFLADAGDDAAIANARRAQAHVTGIFRIEALAGTDAEERQRQAAKLAAAWFRCHLAP